MVSKTKPTPSSSRQLSSSSSDGGSFQKPGDHVLTLGCEFECVLAYPKPKDEQNLSSSRRAEMKNTQGMRAAKIVRVVLSNKFKKKCAGCNEHFDWTPKLTDSKCKGEVDLWRVDYDIETNPTDGENDALGEARFTDYTLIGLEIRTPKLQYRLSNDLKQQACCREGQHIIPYDEEISTVITYLNARLCSLSAGGMQPLFEEINEPAGHTTDQSKTYDQQLQDLRDDGRQRAYLYTNDVSSFHVHVGYPHGPDEQFSVPMVKQILYAMLMWERQIDSLHAVNRISLTSLPTLDSEPRTNDLSPFYDHNVYNQSMSLGFIHKAHVRRFQTNFPRKSYATSPELAYDLESWMKLLRDAESHAPWDLFAFITPKSSVVNISNLKIPNGLLEYPMRTIEFRQSIWTLDATATLSFIDFIVKLTRFCINVTEDKADENFGEKSENRDVRLDIFDIMDKLQCKKETKNHYQNWVSDESNAVQRLTALQQQVSKIKEGRDPKAKEDPFLRFVLHNIEHQRKNFSSQNIQGRIHEKLIKGGYG
jgi:hypothetical protein